MSGARRIAVGIDLGGTMIKSLAVEDGGRVVARASHPTEVHAGQARVVRNLAEVVRELSAQLGSLTSTGAETVKPVGVGVPGVLDVDRGLVVSSPNFTGWEGFPLRDRLEAAISRPVVIENDANAAAVGEQWMGAAAGVKEFLFITIGTGVGGGLVLGGRLWRGPGGRAGEFGHVKVEPQGELCGCGSRGCLERYANAAALERYALEELPKGPSGALRALALDRPEAIDPAVIAHAALEGDAAAQAAYRRFAVYLGMGIADVVNLLDVRHFILGGGVSEAFDLFLPSLREEVAARIYGVPIEAIHILKARCGNDAGSLGMAHIALTQP
ncbi:MAG TPA: ROK family protein [Nitrospiria bacterium]|nr:ROK family protein [Nitrospiria bacterium]